VSDLSGKKALITGAGMGIGQGIAGELARRGAEVAVHYAHTEPDETVSLIEDLGCRAATVQGDLSNVAECEKTVDAAAEALGGLDRLVNNAGVTQALDFLDTDEETYDSVFDLNMKGYFFLARKAVPFMIERGGGSVINITSVHGFAGFPNHTAYAATKGAINAFTRQLAIELTDRKIRVNAVGPGHHRGPPLLRHAELHDRFRRHPRSLGPRRPPRGRGPRRSLPRLRRSRVHNGPDPLRRRRHHGQDGSLVEVGIPNPTRSG
jgi:glucose 1-dehydrogenase